MKAYVSELKIKYTDNILISFSKNLFSLMKMVSTDFPERRPLLILICGAQSGQRRSIVFMIRNFTISVNDIKHFLQLSTFLTIGSTILFKKNFL